MTDFADMLLTPQRKSGGTDNQQVDTDFAAELLGSNRAISGRQSGSGNFPDIKQPQSAISDPRRAASAGTAFMAGIPTDQKAAIRYFARARGIPEDRYATIGGDIVYRGDDGKYYREVVGMGANAAFRVPDVVESVPGIMAGVAAAPLAISSPVGTAGAAGIVGVVDGGANYIRQRIGQSIAGQEIDPVEWGLSGLLSAAGETAPAFVKAFKERRAVSDLAQRNPVTEASLRAKAGQYNVPLTIAELTNLSSLSQQQKALGNLPESSVKMDKFYQQREAKVKQAVDDYLSTISQVDDVADAGLQGQRALEARKAALEAERDDAVKPLYEAAFSSSAPVDTSNVIGKIDYFLKTVPDEGKAAGYLKRMKSLLYRDVPDVDPDTLKPLTDADGKPLTKRAPEDRLPVLHNAKLELDSMFKEETFGSLDKTMQRRLMEVKDELLQQIEKENPDYIAANRKFADMSQPINEFNDRITGTSLTQIPKDNLKNFSRRIFDNPSAKTVKYAKDQIIAGGGEDAWNAVVRSYLDDAWSAAQKPIKTQQGDKIDTGNQWRNILFGDKKRDEALRVALNKDQYQALRDLSEVLQAAGRVRKLGSDTAFNVEINKQLRQNPPVGSIETGIARTVGAILQPQNYGKMVSDWAIERDAAKHADQLVELITKPDAISRLKELRKMKPTEARWWAGTAQLFADYGLIQTRPTDTNAIPEAEGN